MEGCLLLSASDFPQCCRSQWLAKDYCGVSCAWCEPSAISHCAFRIRSSRSWAGSRSGAVFSACWCSRFEWHCNRVLLYGASIAGKDLRASAAEGDARSRSSTGAAACQTSTRETFVHSYAYAKARRSSASGAPSGTRPIHTSQHGGKISSHDTSSIPCGVRPITVYRPDYGGT